jgi:hypothetical protein
VAKDVLISIVVQIVNSAKRESIKTRIRNCLFNAKHVRAVNIFIQIKPPVNIVQLENIKIKTMLHWSHASIAPVVLHLNQKKIKIKTIYLNQQEFPKHVYCAPKAIIKTKIFIRWVTVPLRFCAKRVQPAAILWTVQYPASLVLRVGSKKKQQKLCAGLVPQAKVGSHLIKIVKFAPMASIERTTMQVPPA